MNKPDLGLNLKITELCVRKEKFLYEMKSHGEYVICVSCSFNDGRWYIVMTAMNKDKQAYTLSMCGDLSITESLVIPFPVQLRNDIYQAYNTMKEWLDGNG